jgi:urea transporter/murein DD-endopeptidase MepM/ murein hydrolase activator NlpD
MEPSIRNKIIRITETVLNSYSQVFFSRSSLLAVFLVIISFFDYGAGISGLLSVIIANLLAYWLGYNEYYLKSGLYGFNALLVGLGIGLFYEPSVQLYILVVISAITCFLFTVVLQGVLGKYGLPFLSVPFLAAIWMVSLAGGELTSLNISERGIYVYNEIYALGGQTLVNLYDWLENAVRSSFLKVYFYSLGAIFFQTGLLAGMIIALGLLIYSRITFVLSVLGYAIAYLFYNIVGIEFNSLGYTYIGFNYILTAIAIGGYYLVPGRSSFLWIFILLPAVVLITLSTQQIFLIYRISPYSLPFNFVVLTFLYALKLREKRVRRLVETPVQLGNPEKNLYLFSGNLKRFPMAYPVAASLPFYGEWTVSQGHNGEHTHKGDWRHAWDFVITDEKGKQFKGTGDSPEEYHCFGKSILAPADGKVVETVSNIADNTIGNVDTKHNWGNSVIIQHNDKTFSKLSHLKCHSISVKEGDNVRQGQIIGKCGNSGRSPYPHLHFQFQGTPYIGSPTQDYPLGHYLLKKAARYELKTFDFPQKDQMVANPPGNELLEKILHFIPGQKFHVEVETNDPSSTFRIKNGTWHWSVHTDVLNTTYLQCEEDKSRAYLYNNGSLHYFTNFTGNKKNPLFWFFLSLYMVPVGFLPNSKINDCIPINMVFGGLLKFIQDLTAPVFLFLKADYELSFTKSNDSLFSDDIHMETVLKQSIAGRNSSRYFIHTSISREGYIKIKVTNKKSELRILCKNDLK